MKKKTPDQLEKEKLKRRKEFLKFQRDYRLKHPLFNLLYKMDPVEFGFAIWFVSGFAWYPIYDPYMGPRILLAMVITGLIAWFIARVSHKEFEKEKSFHGFQDQTTVEYEDRNISF